MNNPVNIPVWLYMRGLYNEQKERDSSMLSLSFIFKQI